jgi:hypothetical protein
VNDATLTTSKIQLATLGWLRSVVWVIAFAIIAPSFPVARNGRLRGVALIGHFVH